MASKRGNSEGSIRKRADGRWEARYVDVEGKRQSLYGDTRQEAARQLTEALRNRDQGVHVATDRRTVGEYLLSWFTTVKKHEVKPSSHCRYGFDLRLHLVPSLGHHQLTRLTAQHIQTFLASELDKGYALATVSHLYVVLHDALDDAMRLGLVPRNVADMVKGPRVLRHEYAIYSEEQARQLLDTVAGHRLEALLVLALTTGMREGELDTLQWRDVNLNGGSLWVRRTLQRTDEGWRWNDAKTAHSRRRIALPELAIAALRRHRARQAQERLQVGEAWQDQDFVFTDALGGRLSCNWFSTHPRRWYGSAVRRAGLPVIRFHDLRHTAATLLLARGVNPKVVSEMLGHSSVAVTLTLYGHVTPHMQQEAAATMEQALGGSTGQRKQAPR